MAQRFRTNPAKDMRRVEHAMTKAEYLAKVERLGRPVEWAPHHSRHPSPMTAMNDTHCNQVPPAKTQS